MYFLLNIHILFLFAILAPFVDAMDAAQPPKIPGVAFSLTPDYGTAAIYFPNSSHAKVAYIEGGPSYKAFMRRKAVPSPSNKWCEWLAPSLAPLTFGACSAVAISDFESARALINSLEASVAAYLGTGFCFADLVIPERGQEYHRGTIERALMAVGLRQSYGTNENSWRAVYANNIRHPDDPTFPPRLVLAIDYSKSGLRLSLFADDYGLIDCIRHDYYPSLGASHDQGSKHWGNMVETVKEFIKPPFESTPDSTEVPGPVEQIVLYGDAVPNDKLVNLLSNVVDAGIAKDAYSADPVFIAAIGGADGSYAAQNDIDFKYKERKAAFGCQWRSKLYHPKENHGEL